MFSGKPPQRSGGNVQREKFAAGVHEGKDRGETKVKSPASPKPGGEGGNETRIEHHGDGTHTIHHADGETHEGVHTGAMAMHLHAKHEDGPAMHMHQHDGMSHHEGMPEGTTHTSHHVGHDGMVEGPHHHMGEDAAAEHMKQVLGADGGNGAIEDADGPGTPHGLENLY